ncbi:MAG: AlwI family type II restriction endonuclease [Mycoplasmatales bacterium]|nr:AlwI family type II restriction endonuclease [Mycoplasmatales bacterium]
MRWKIYAPGTTSARSSDIANKMFDLIIELNNFWSENDELVWNDKRTQTYFAEHLLEVGFMSSDLNNAEKIQKFVRQKTSLIEQLGFVTPSRRITPLGYKLIDGNNFDPDLTSHHNQQTAFLIGLLNFEEDGVFIYRDLIEHLSRNSNQMTIESFKTNFMISNPKNDEELLTMIRGYLPINNLEEFTNLVPHQKGTRYNTIYYEKFNSLLDTTKNANRIWEEMSSQKTLFWKELKKLVFGTSNKRELNNFIIERNESSILLAFLIAKRNSLLTEYFDLTRRILSATGLIYCTPSSIHLSPILSDLIRELGFNDIGIYTRVRDIFTLPIDRFENNHNSTLEEMVLEQRHSSFENFLDESLTKERVSEFLINMANDDYSEISTFFNNSSNNATYTEFLVSVAFHYISEREDCFVTAWHGQLADNNLPLRHAPGSTSDSTFLINDFYYVVEATKMQGQQQTTNEVAPISSHLYTIESNNKLALLFARNIFSETHRQLEIQRNSENYIYGWTFEHLANILLMQENFTRKIRRLNHVQ